MTRPRVKICGITRRADAQLAAELGADAIGFVFWPGSPRAIAPERARAIADGLPAHVTRVGVFVNATPASVKAIAADAALTAVQLHGDEDVSRFDAGGLAIIKAVTLTDEDDVERAVRLPASVTVLVDAYAPLARGGTGQLADWLRAARLATRRPVMLAGGLNRDNLADALRTVRPWAIDVSSGVEDAPGFKSSGRLRELFGALRDRPAAVSGGLWP